MFPDKFWRDAIKEAGFVKSPPLLYKLVMFDELYSMK
jgi:hypothetical protein